MDIDVQRDEHRLFLIFAASPQDENSALQDSLLKGSEEDFAERDLLRGYFFEDGTGSFDGAPVSSREVAAVHERFGVEPGRFATLLVGKDGTVKYRFDEPVGLVEIYALIDAHAHAPAGDTRGGRGLITAGHPGRGHETFGEFTGIRERWIKSLGLPRAGSRHGRDLC